MLMRIFAILFVAVCSAYSQPWGELGVSIDPKIVRPEDSVSFSAGIFTAHRCPYNSTYLIEKTATGPILDSFVVLVTSVGSGGQCALAAGYSGPFIQIKAPYEGHYTIKFDSSSSFKADMGDSANFLVSHTAFVRKGVNESIEKRKPYRSYLINGRIVNRNRTWGGLSVRKSENNNINY